MGTIASPTNLSITANVVKRLAEVPTWAEKFQLQASPSNAQNVLIFRMDADGTFPDGTLDQTNPNVMYILTPGQILPLPIGVTQAGELNREQISLHELCAISTANARLFINPVTV